MMFVNRDITINNRKLPVYEIYILHALPTIVRSSMLHDRR